MGPLQLEARVYLEKALEDLSDAKLALSSGRHNTCARNSYYAAFHAAVAALWVEGIRPAQAGEGTLSHKMVQAEWAVRLVNRRKIYPPELRRTLLDLIEMRIQADYSADHVTPREARRAAAACEHLVRHVVARLSPDGQVGD